jgi:hypothetical protein
LCRRTLTAVLDLDAVDGGRPGCSATNVERTHRELSAGLANGLSGDDADRLADVDQVATRQIAPVALGCRHRSGVSQVIGERTSNWSTPS